MSLLKDPNAVCIYGNFKDYEFFSASEEALKARYEIKKNIEIWIK